MPAAFEIEDTRALPELDFVVIRWVGQSCGDQVDNWVCKVQDMHVFRDGSTLFRAASDGVSSVQAG